MVQSISLSDLYGALDGLNLYAGLRPPYGDHPANYFQAEGVDPITEEAWNLFPWNPPPQLSVTEPDPSASPKPSWEDVVSEAAVYDYYYVRPYSLQNATEKLIEDEAARPIAHQRAKGLLDVGQGINRMAAMIHRASETLVAGKEWHKAIVVEDEGQDTFSIETPKEAQELLDNLARVKERADSAGSLFYSNARRLYNILRDPAAGLPDTATLEEKIAARQKAGSDLQDLLGNPEPAYREALHNYDRLVNELPDDLDRRREVFAVRIGVEANRRANFVKNVSEGQDAFLPATCADQEASLQAISRARQHGLIVLANADTAQGMQDAYDEAIIGISGVPVFNSPRWTQEPADQPLALTDGVLEIEWDVSNPPEDGILVNVRARHPNLPPTSADADTGDTISVDPWRGRDWIREVVNRNRNEKTVQVVFVPAPLRPPESTTLRLVARNDCGPSELVIKVKIVDSANPGPGA